MKYTDVIDDMHFHLLTKAQFLFPVFWTCFGLV